MSHMVDKVKLATVKDSKTDVSSVSLSESVRVKRRIVVEDAIYIGKEELQQTMDYTLSLLLLCYIYLDNLIALASSRLYILRDCKLCDYSQDQLSELLDALLLSLFTFGSNRQLLQTSPPMWHIGIIQERDNILGFHVT